MQGAGSILELHPNKKLKEYPKADAPRQAVDRAWKEILPSPGTSELCALNERTMREGLPRLSEELARMRKKGIIDENGNRINNDSIDEKLLEHDCDV